MIELDQSMQRARDRVMVWIRVGCVDMYVTYRRTIALSHFSDWCGYQLLSTVHALSTPVSSAHVPPPLVTTYTHYEAPHCCIGFVPT